MKKILLGLGILTTLAMGATEVTMENFAHAETASYFTTQQGEAPVNQFKHERVPVNLKNQTIIRSNTDLLYSTAVVDVSKGARFSLPKGSTYQIMHLMDENQYIPAVVYPGQEVVLTKDNLTSGSYVYILMRTATTSGIKHANELQDKAIINANSAIKYKADEYDKVSLDKLRAILEEDVNNIDTAKAFGTPETTDTYQHILGSATGWAGLSPEHAIYTSRAGVEGAGKITFDIPNLNYDNGGYWSITAYDSKGWIATENTAITSFEAEGNGNGTITVNFNQPGVKNNINTVKGWNYAVRMYMPVNVEEMKEYMKKFPMTEKVQ